MARSSRAQIKKAKGNVKRFEKASSKDLRKDVKETSDIIDAAFGNVSSTHKGTKKRLNKYNSKQMDTVLRMKDRMNAAGRRDVRRVKGREDKFGTMGGMLEGVYTRSNKNAEQGAKTGDAIAEGGKRLVDNLDETSRTALQMMKYGAQEAKAGAKEALYEAEAVRARSDAEMAAQMRHDIQMQKIAIQAQEEADARALANQKKILRFQDRLAEDTLGTDTASQIRGIADTYTSLASDMYNSWQEALEAGEMDPATKNKLFQDILINNGITDPTNIGKARALWNQLTTDTKGVSGHEELVSDISDFLIRNIRGVPGWEELGKGKGKKSRADIVDKWVRNIVGTGLADTGAGGGGNGGNPRPGEPATNDPGLIGLVGNSYQEVREAIERKAEADLSFEPPEARDTTINWFRANAEAMLKDAMPDTPPDGIKEIVDRIIEGAHWDTAFFGPNYDRKLPAEARSVINKLFMTLPRGDKYYGRGVFKFDNGKLI